MKETEMGLSVRCCEREMQEIDTKRNTEDKEMQVNSNKSSKRQRKKETEKQ